ncbi:MAG: hypothetical protein ACYCSX_11960 [Acidimicrobiales bacterium]
MSAFTIVHQDRIAGKLVCFDRLIFKGLLTRLYQPGGMKGFLDSQHVLLKDFAPYVTKMSVAIKAAAKGAAEAAGRPYLYLGKAHTKRSGTSKEDLARNIAERDRVEEGLVCVLAAVEPCKSFEVYKNRTTHRLEVVRRPRACLHFYYYFIDSKLGFCHVRIQSWFPFEIQVWVNGREALSRALTSRRVPHLRYLNAIVKVANFGLAQRLSDRLASRRWHRVLSSLVREVNPHLPVLTRAGVGPYWWVVDQAEVATDVVFTSRRGLEEVLPGLIAHASSAFGAEDVLRFLGRKLTPQLACEVTSDARRRPEGWRIKHRMGRNSIKCYDKANVLRVETTINDPTQFRVLRVIDRARVWRPMRKGVANLPRYFQVGRAANERYLDALAAAPSNRHGTAVLDRHTRPIKNRGKRHPRLNPIGHDDLCLFRAVLAGEHTITGFSNKEVTARLHPRPPIDQRDAHRRCERTTRLIAKLRGHGLVAKIPRRRRYRVTAYGHRVMSAAIAFHDHDFPAAYEAAA